MLSFLEMISLELSAGAYPSCPSENNNVTLMHEFCINRAGEGCCFKEVDLAMQMCHGVKAISRSGIYKILAKAGEDVSDQHTGGIQTVRTADFVEVIGQFVEDNTCMIVKEVVEAFDISRTIIHATLFDDLGLSPEAARWIIDIYSFHASRYTQEFKGVRTRASAYSSDLTLRTSPSFPWSRGLSWGSPWMPAASAARGNASARPYTWSTCGLLHQGLQQGDEAM